METRNLLIQEASWAERLEQGWETLLRQSRQFFFPELAVDLGTSQTRLYMPGKGVVLEAPSIIALSGRNRTEIVAVGHDAKILNGRAPAEIHVIQPIKEGVIEHYQAAALMLRAFLRRVLPNRIPLQLHLLLATPSDLTPLERKAVREAAREAGATRVTLLEEAVASALGTEIHAERAHTSVIIDLGAGTTDIAVVSRGELVQGRTLRFGSSALDQAILQYLRHERGFETGAENAERIKLELAALKGRAQQNHLEIRGRNLTTRLPEFFTITDAEVRAAIEPAIQNLTNFIRTTLEEVPLKAALDLLDTGVVLSGGGALLPGLADWLADEMKIGVWLSAEPKRATIDGLGRLLEGQRSATPRCYLIERYDHLGATASLAEDAPQGVRIQTMDEQPH